MYVCQKRLVKTKSSKLHRQIAQKLSLFPQICSDLLHWNVNIFFGLQFPYKPLYFPPCYPDYPISANSHALGVSLHLWAETFDLKLMDHFRMPGFKMWAITA